MKSHRLNLTAAALAGALLMTNCGEDAPRTNPAGPSMIEPPASTAPGTATQTAAPVGGHARRMPQAPAGVQPVSTAPAIDLTNLPEGVSAADAARWMRERNALVMNAYGGRPGPVGNLRASTLRQAGGGTQSILRILWDRPSDTGDSTITGYKLEIEDLTGSIVRSTSHPPGSTGIALPLNFPFGEYLIWVAAVNSRGTGQWSLLIYEYEAETETVQPPGRVRDLRAGDTNPPRATCEESAANGCVRDVRATWSAPNSGGTPSGYVVKIVNLSLPRAERPYELISHIAETSTTESLGSGEWLIEVRAENDAGTGEPQHTTFIVTGPFDGDSVPSDSEDAKVTQLDSRGHRWRMTWNPPAMPTSAPWKSPVIRYRIVTGIGCRGPYPHDREIRPYQINDRNRNNTPYEAAFSAVPGPHPEGSGVATGFTIYAENAAGIGFCTPAVVVPR